MNPRVPADVLDHRDWLVSLVPIADAGVWVDLGYGGAEDLFLAASKHLSPELKDRIRNLFFSMHDDPKGQKILTELMIDKFIRPKDEWYDSIRQMELKIALLGENKS